MDGIVSRSMCRADLFEKLLTIEIFVCLCNPKGESPCPRRILKTTRTERRRQTLSFADPTITVSLDSEHECVDVSPSNQQLTDAHQEAIRLLAHEKWEAAGCPAGDGVDFWLEAEREVNAERSGSSTDQG